MAVDETYFERKRCCGGGVRAQRSRVCLQMRLLAGRRCCLAVDDATEGSFVGLVSLCPRFAGCRILCGTRSLDCRRRLRSLFRCGSGKRLPHNRQLTTPSCRHARPNRDLLQTLQRPCSMEGEDRVGLGSEAARWHKPINDMRIVARFDAGSIGHG